MGRYLLTGQSKDKRLLRASKQTYVVGILFLQGGGDVNKAYFFLGDAICLALIVCSTASAAASEAVLAASVASLEDLSNDSSAWLDAAIDVAAAAAAAAAADSTDAKAAATAAIKADSINSAISIEAELFFNITMEFIAASLDCSEELAARLAASDALVIKALSELKASEYLVLTPL